ncbi:MAG: HIG1 domain-containing protein [Rickettsiaceae bacterium]
MLVLLGGLLSMARGGEISKKFGIKLMTLRVVFQGLALLTLVGIYFFSSK